MPCGLQRGAWVCVMSLSVPQLTTPSNTALLMQMRQMPPSETPLDSCLPKSGLQLLVFLLSLLPWSLCSWAFYFAKKPRLGMSCNKLPTHAGMGPVTGGLAIAGSRGGVTCKVLGRARSYSRPLAVFSDMALKR